MPYCPDATEKIGPGAGTCLWYLQGGSAKVRPTLLVTISMAPNHSKCSPRFLYRTFCIPCLFHGSQDPLSPYNSILKYADDTSILVPQHSSVSMQEEFWNVQTWSTANKLQINLNKTKEIVFGRPSLRNFITPRLLPFIEQLTVISWSIGPMFQLLFPPLYMLSTLWLLQISDYIIIDFPNLGLTYNGGWCSATKTRWNP